MLTKKSDSCSYEFVYYSHCIYVHHYYVWEFCSANGILELDAEHVWTSEMLQHMYPKTATSTIASAL